MRRMTGNGGGHGAVKAEKLLPKTKRTEGTVLPFSLMNPSGCAAQTDNKPIAFFFQDGEAGSFVKQGYLRR